MNWLRLWWPIVLLGLIIILLSNVGVYFITMINLEIGKMFRWNVDSLTAAQEMRIAYRDFRHKLLLYQIDQNPVRLTELPDYRERLISNLAKAEASATTEREKALIQRVQSGLNDFFLQFDSWQKNGSNREGLLELNRLMEESLVKEVLEPNREYLNLNAALLVKREKETLEISDFVYRAFVLIGISGVALGIGGGWMVSSWLKRSQNRINRKLLSTSRILSGASHSQKKDTPIPNTAPWDLLDDVEGSAKKIAERVRKTEMDALRAEQLAKVGQMAAGIAHEIRNPLTSIKVLLQNLENRRGPTGRTLSDREWRIMEDEVDRMETKLNEFLDFARPPRPVRKNTDLRSVIRESIDPIQARADLQEIHLVGPQQGQPIFAEIDQGQFRQVLTNLLINGLDAQPSGGWLKVEIESFPETSADENGSPNGKRIDPQTKIVIRIRDTGPGLPENLGNEIFEPFFSTKDSGMGLGLSICRRIVESHNGTLEGANHPEGGAVFTVKIPGKTDHSRIAV